MKFDFDLVSWMYFFVVEIVEPVRDKYVELPYRKQIDI